MLILLSPAKSLNFKTDSPTHKFSEPRFLNKSVKIANTLKNYSPANLKDLMKVSTGLSELNYLRYQKWEIDHSVDNSKQALFVFDGEVYNGLDAYSLKTEDINFAQKHLRILSGLYGILQPLDLVQPYRLEMGSPLKFGQYRNLYQFWSKQINKAINDELKEQKSKALINLASNEYSKAVILKEISSRIITPVFKELKGDEYKIITVYAKKARGMMTRYIIENKIEDPEQIKLFELGGYAYSDNLSDENEWVFTR